MPPGKSQASKYRNRARDLRAIAAEVKDPKTKQILLETAEEYERMASDSASREAD